MHELDRGREAYARREWEVAYQALAHADRENTLSPVDLERLAWAAGLTGRDEEFLAALERLYQSEVEGERLARAARCGFWLGIRLSLLGEMGRAGGWLARAQRLVEREGNECVEAGYLLLPAVIRHLAAGDLDGASDLAGRAAEMGERFRDADLVGLARSFQGRALLRSGRLPEGLANLDEAMVAASGGELSPLVTGLVYCSVIASCHEIYALERAREWTSALSRWCEEQPQLIAFTGSCQVHRAEILQLGGAWRDAIEEARRASAGADRDAIGEAFYQQGEIGRLRGEDAAAEEAYRRASQAGREPLPGMALLRLSQGRKRQAASAIRRALAATTGHLARVRLLPATVEIMLAAGAPEEARAACHELEGIAASFDSEVLEAMAAHARGAVALAGRDAQGAVGPLRRACAVWQQIGAPYLVARIRVAIAQSCRTLGDDDGMELELDAAREVFVKLGAAPDLARIDALVKAGAGRRDHGLTAREHQVLRLLAAGKTNKEIAGELDLSERTVDRHVSNMFGKLGVTTRAAATAYAYEHELL